MDRNLALELVRVTEAAALVSSKFMGRGDKNGADGAAVEAMRKAFESVNISGEVVIGEGELDEAPMLYIGEKVGKSASDSMEVDIAVDPLDGTTLIAKGLPNVISVIAIGSIPVTPYGTPSTYEVPDAIAPYLQEHDVLLLANHGALTVGADLITAYYRMETLELYAKISLTAHLLGGEKEVFQQVESLLSIRVNYLVEIDYAAFRNLIDAIGGVEMYIDRNMYYDDDAQDLHIHFNAGETVLLDGKKAEEFFRWRKNNDGTGLAEGDIGRINDKGRLVLLKRNPEIILLPTGEKISRTVTIRQISALDGVAESYVTLYDDKLTADIVPIDKDVREERFVRLINK